MFYWHVHDETWRVGASFKTLPLDVRSSGGSEGTWQPQAGSFVTLEFPDNHRTGGEIVSWDGDAGLGAVMLEDGTLWRVRRQSAADLWEVIEQSSSSSAGRP